MNSIKKKLSRYLSITVSLFLFAILLATDISVDTWISNEFDTVMVNKSQLLTTLVDENFNQVEFHFSDEFMPEFSGKHDAEYFQLWYENEIFERSKTLDLFSINTLPKVDVELNTSKIINITLPDGRSGRMITHKFIPQIDSDIKENNAIAINKLLKTQQPIVLAYAISNEKLDQTLWFLDIIFFISVVSTILVVRFIVYKVVEKGLKPLDKLNVEITSMNVTSEVNAISIDQLPNELLPIAESINYFLSENKSLYAREKRITSDIAHELKTPITELINLSEIAIKFPYDKAITETFSVDVLEISQRLKGIVNSILLLQKSTNSTELVQEYINITDLINNIICRVNEKDRDVIVTIPVDVTPILSNKFAIATVLTNLISNALYYSPPNSQVSISLIPDINNAASNKIMLSISNVSVYQYSAQELTQFFDPLWQKDPSRTSSQRYGLGLSIVKSYCDNINADIAVTITPEKQITFTLKI